MSLKGFDGPAEFTPYMLCNATTMLKIYDQESFEWFFGDGTETGSGTTGGGWVYSESGGLVTVTIPFGQVVIFVPCELEGTTNTFNSNMGYILKTRVKVSPYVNMIGFNDNKVIIARDDTSGHKEDLKFFTESLDTQAATVSGGDRFNITSTAGYSEGDLVVYEKNNTFYKIVDVVSGTQLRAERSIDDTGGGSAQISRMNQGIVFSGWAFDGRCGINGLGGSVVDSTRNGGGLLFPYCGNSILTLKGINCQTGLNGGFISGEGLSAYLNIRNIVSCQAGSPSTDGQGGAVYGCHHSSFKDIRFNKAYYAGGGIAGCNFAQARQFYACQALDGYSLTAIGGGLYNCKYSFIEMIEDCRSEGHGGAGFGCDYSKISMIIGNIAANNGGGFCDSDYSELSNFFRNTASDSAAYNCNNSNYLGVWSGNTGGNIDAADSIATITYDGGSYVSSSAESLDL